ncbi:hypothetical protein ACJZ2D_016119 [Fusarium nematophilum]
MWEEVAKPAIVEFDPKFSSRIRFERMRVERLLRGSREGRATFERFHSLVFQDCSFQWRRMNPVKDTFLTTDMRLPTPKLHIELPRKSMSILPVSQPMRKLASVFHDWNDVHSPGVDLEEVGRRPLDRRLLPEVREFTMMGPRLQADDYCSQNSSLQADENTPATKHWYDVLSVFDDDCSETVAASNRNDVDVPRSRPQWYGFRYYLGSGRVEFSPLAWYEVEEMVLAGTNTRSGLPGMAVKLWIGTVSKISVKDRNIYDIYGQYKASLEFQKRPSVLGMEVDTILDPTWDDANRMLLMLST